ncbi:MAG: acetyl-CoA acetyltransferase [Deltaproteobacteria bacterium]
MTFILGGVQSDFARHLAREQHEVADLVGELLDGALAAAALEPGDIQTIHVGNAFGQLFTGQGQLGAMPATVRPALWGVPAARHEAACASGSIAILAALTELAAGHYDVALVLGVEQERNVPGEDAARFLGAAAWVGHEGQGARYLWPHMFSQIGDAYAERWGLDPAHLTAIAQKNLANARANPLAQTRTWALDDATFGDPAKNYVVEGRLRRYDCAQVTDGGAALVLASPRFAASWAARRGKDLETTPRILGWGHRTAGLSLGAKLERSAHTGGLLVPHVAEAVADARARADRGKDRISAYEIHDCFTTTEYLAIDHLGLTAPGESFKAIESGATQRTGATPVNPSGGLIGGGHPVGATGVRMALDAAHQVAGTAGAMQVEAATAVQTLNLGGSATTIVSFVIGI